MKFLQNLVCYVGHNLINKWDIIRVYRHDLMRPHDKYCICICPVRMWFFYINSEPPVFRKKRDYAIVVENFQISCITHTSYIDTTTIIFDLPKDNLEIAISAADRCYGSISPSLRRTIIQRVKLHGALNPDEELSILE